MKKRDPARLYPKYDGITIQNFLLENKQLIILIIIIALFTLLIIGCLFCIDLFRGEHFYNYMWGE